MNIQSFFDELQSIRMAKQAQITAPIQALQKLPIAKALPWLAAAGIGGAGVLGAQDVKKTWDLGQQVRKAQEQQGY